MDKLQNLINQTAGGILSAPERLHPPEAWWSRHQPFLAEKCGYMLRPRYHPEWIPSWYSSSKNPRKCDDGIPMPVMQAYHYMDAIRMADNEPVMLKRVRVPPYNPQAESSKGGRTRERKRKHSKRDPSSAAQSQTYINGNASRSFNSNSNTSVHVSANEEKADRNEPDPPEVQILNVLSSKPYDLPTNYCARLIDIFDMSDRNSGDVTDIILVLPFLRSFNDPPFLTVAEGLEFIRQALDAVLFLHSNNIAHKDCGAASFMYDPSYIYPEGYHPVLTQMSRDLKKRAKHYSRTEFPPRYYITNFSYAKLYDRSEGILDFPVFASDTTVPEYAGLEYNNKHDPFAADVYLFGNMLRKEFLEDKHGFEFLGPLVESMTHPTPARRPKIKQCAERFFAICAYVPGRRLRKRFVSGPEGESEKILNSVSHMFRNVKYSMLGIPPAYMGQYIGKSPKHYDGIESPFLWGKVGETTYRVSCELVDLSSPTVSHNGYPKVASHQRSYSFSDARPAEWKTEFLRQQKMHRMQLEGRTHEGFPFNVQPQGSREPSTSRPGGTGRDSRYLITQQPIPSQNRGRAHSDSGYYPNRVASGSQGSTMYNPQPSPFTGKRATPTYAPAPAQTYVMAHTETPVPAHAQRRGYYPPPGRVSTNDTDNTDTTHIESISSVTQTQETFVGNGNENGNVNGSGGNHHRHHHHPNGEEAHVDVNADVSNLDLGLDVPTDVGEPDVSTGTRTPRRYRLAQERAAEKEKQAEVEMKALTSKLENERLKESEVAGSSKSRPAHSGTVRSNESSRENGGTLKSKSNSQSKSKSKSKSKQEKRESLRRTRGTDEFNMMFPEPEALSPVLSPMYQVNNDLYNHQGERVASPDPIPMPIPVPVSPSNAPVPASLLTGLALSKREGSIHSMPVPASEGEVFEGGTSPVDNIVGEDGRMEMNGARLDMEEGYEAREDDTRHHEKHRSGEHHHHHHHHRRESRNDSPKKQRSTKWDCVLCYRQLSSRAESIEHMQSEHSSYYICLRCGSYYTTAQHLEHHKKKRGHMDADTSLHASASRKHRHREYYEFPKSENFNHQ